MDVSKLNTKQLYINGEWRDSKGGSLHPVINPATEETLCEVIQGTLEDVDDAVVAAKAAFKEWRHSRAAKRQALIHAIADGMEARKQDLIDAVSQALGCPPHITEWLHIDGPIYAMRYYADRAALMEETEKAGHSVVLKEPVGVCGFITPWNYPLH
ncbi:aldehyde dehydrogenase family protein, partial [Microbulbifer mangrovi]|uniref:aldehyde dehydrogenase family protein n=1 Tax=Microbulbifer mangrovi TaxID=927787 RepID=UPI00117EF932